MANHLDAAGAGRDAAGDTEADAAPVAEGSVSSSRRRRRRSETAGRRDGVTAPRQGDGAAPAAPESARRRLRPRTGRWRLPEFVRSWGLSPTFRVFLFLGGILGVLAFLLYNEYVINEFKEQEHGRVELYALLYGLAVSPEVSEGVAGPIFQKIISNPDISFPVVVTDHRGDILMWDGPGLPPVDDRSPAALDRVRAITARMDAANEPVKSFEQSVARGRVVRLGQSLVVTDAVGEPVVWHGPELPPSGDSTVAARNAVRALVVEHGKVVTEVEVPAQLPSALLHGAGRFAIIDPMGQPVAWGGRGLPAIGDTAAAARQRVEAAVRDLQLAGAARSFRIPTEKYIHYGHSDLISHITLAPVVSVGALLLFALVGYMGFRNLRRSEQRSIWVGMAKETAHQLGTPLSSLAGWLELMASRIDSAPEEEAAAGSESLSAAAIAREMQRDMRRLNQIASRFSQIGSVPELQHGDVREVIEETIAYFRSRGPQFGRHRFEMRLDEVPPVPMNTELIGWALENLIKNSMDAVGVGEGVIEVCVGPDPDREAAQITVRDNGRGIEPENLARVFEPGFSTKKRGWGLGLAFVRRIVEEYHGGRIRILKSERGQGTTFEICLPLA